MTVVSHDSERVTGESACGTPGCHSVNVTYGASLAQLASLANVSTHCEQLIKYECRHAKLFRDGTSWWVSRDGGKKTYWGGAPPGSESCACGNQSTCANVSVASNCDTYGDEGRMVSGLLSHKDDLPVTQLRFGVTNPPNATANLTLGKLRCYGLYPYPDQPCLHHGKCERQGGSLRCSCMDGFTGRHCETG